MPKASVLQFDNYTVEELLFKKEPVKADQNEFQLQPLSLIHISEPTRRS